jgi:hypothetical protein
MHQDISYSGENTHDVNELKEYININGAEIEFTNLDEYSELNKICLVYGDDVSSFVCANSTSTLILRTYKYYKGPITVVLADESTNIYKVLFENVTLNNGYHIEDFEYEGIEGDIYNEYEVTSEVSDLVALACDSEEDCMDTIKVYASYGDAEKLLSNNANYSTIKLPTYLEMINAGFTSKSCAFQRCDETIEVYVQYEIGGVEQRISAKYSYIDKLPQMSYVMDQYAPTRSYNFSELNLNNLYTQRELFATAFPITLEDGEGNTYNAQIHSRFIKYIDREGNVSPINNALYTYIGNNNKNFGYYLLEGYVKVLNEDIYGKSFFIMVELADKDAPVLTLVGEETMKIKQYDVFKDPEFNCNDASECHTTIKYYYQNENNEVEEIDTNVYGKYIIKYTAVDGDGNVTTLTRIVEVESVNAMNATSIIIIVAVVVLLVGSIVIAIIIEKKKNKEED